MKARNFFQYFLFLAIVLGAFASMAQNGYGLRVIAWSCYLFGFSYLVAFFLRIHKLSWERALEYVGLTLLLVLFGLRAAYIHFPYIEWIVVISSALLVIVYSKEGLSTFRQYQHQNRVVSVAMAVYYLAVTSFLFSVLLRPFQILVSDGFGVLGGLCIGILIILVVFRNSQMVDGEEVRVWRLIGSREDHSSVILTGFFLISLYVGLYTIRVLPPLYTDEVPKAYIELVNEAETGKEQPVDGKYRHNEYKEALEKFLERHGQDN